MKRIAVLVLSALLAPGEAIPRTPYHSSERGWIEHERTSAAFPFVKGEIALDAPEESLPPEALAGKRLFLSACVLCHAGRAADERVAWQLRGVSYPAGNSTCVTCHDRVRAGEKAPQGLRPVSHPARGRGGPGVNRPDPRDPFDRHEIPPRIAKLTPLERRGEALYRKNCAFCHAADGTGLNWIGAFMQPHPRDLTDPAFMSGMTRAALKARIRDGLPGTSMPAWKDVLRERDIDAVVAYVARAFHPPSD